MPKENRPLKVFLCHASVDKPAVQMLYQRLVENGVDVWLDKEKLLPGQDWELEIRKAVSESDVVVVCLSKQFNQAGFRQKEVRLALDTAMEKPEGEIFIIPARLEVCELPENLRRWHSVNLFEKNGYLYLLRSLGSKSSIKKISEKRSTQEVDANLVSVSEINTPIMNNVNNKKIDGKRKHTSDYEKIDKLENEIAELESQFNKAVHSSYDKEEIVHLVGDTKNKVIEIDEFINDALERLTELRILNLRNYYYR